MLVAAGDVDVACVVVLVIALLLNGAAARGAATPMSTMRTTTAICAVGLVSLVDLVAVQQLQRPWGRATGDPTVLSPDPWPLAVFLSRVTASLCDWRR